MAESQSDSPAKDEAAERPPLGDQTGAALLTLFQDFYRQEIGAEEDVHRTLPFFATALGLIVAALNYVASQLPTWADVRKTCGLADDGAFSNWHLLRCAAPVLICASLLIVAALASIGVLWLLALATKRRDYERVGPEDAALQRARDLQEYHSAAGLSDDALDAAVLCDLRDQLIEDFAKAIPLNRKINLQRYMWRARAVSYLIWSLLSALLATILILTTAKFGLLLKVLP